MGFNGTRLKVQLKLAINRLKMLQNKKTNQNAVARKQIGALLDKGKEESSRIKVEHIIREDYMIEAMELIELYCDLLLARYGIIEQMKYCDDGIKEAVNTVIWVAPRLTAEVQELTLIREQLIAKYGKEFAMEAMEGRGVSERVIRKFSIQAPENFLVTQYLIEIARAMKINWVPPAEDTLMAPLDDQMLIGPPPPLTPDVVTLGVNNKGPGPSNNGGTGGGGGGFTLPPMQNFAAAPPSGSAAYPPTSPQQQAQLQQQFVQAQQPQQPQQHQQQQYPPQLMSFGGPSSSSSGSSSAAAQPPNYSAPAPSFFPGYNAPVSNMPSFPSVPSGSPSFHTSEIPNFPAVPPTLPGERGHGGGGGGGAAAKDDDEQDFDDLTRRFNALKKRT